MKKWWIMKGFFYLLFGIAFVLVFGYIVMSLWNWLIPDIFDGPTVTYVEALGVLLLSKILFGSLHCGSGRHKCCNHDGHKTHWRKKWEKKMSNMTPEQREKYKHCFEGKFGSSEDEEKCLEETDKEQESKES
jgi:hypothetical protein